MPEPKRQPVQKLRSSSDCCELRIRPVFVVSAQQNGMIPDCSIINPQPQLGISTKPFHSNTPPNRLTLHNASHPPAKEVSRGLSG